MKSPAEYLDEFYKLSETFNTNPSPSQSQVLLTKQLTFFADVFEDGWRAGVEDAEHIKDNLKKPKND